MSNSKSNEKAIDYIIDATNVCNWHIANRSVRTSEKNEYNANVSLDTLLKLLDVLLDHGKSFQCIFDANTAFNLPASEREIYDQLLADYKDFFYQVTGGIKADSFVLSIASNYDSRVISNDNFSDYQGSYPWVRRETRPQRLFKGGIPIIAGVKHLVVPELDVNAALSDDTAALFHQLRTKLGFGNNRMEGLIKSFDFKKGTGFIETASGEEVYFNRSQLNIKEGDKVDFLIKVNNDQKTFAADIVFTQLEQNEEDKQMKVWDGEEISEGTIEWFNEPKGFGVISQVGFDETIFFFRNGYLEEGAPRQGQPVVFEKKINKKGPHAINIRGGKAENFILKKDIIGTSDIGKESEKLKKENATLNKKIELLLPLVKASNSTIYTGTVKKYDNGKGLIVLDGGKLELDFMRSNISGNIEKEMKAGQRVEFKTILGKKSVRANQVKLSNKPLPANSPKSPKSLKSPGSKPNTGKDAVPGNTKNPKRANGATRNGDNKSKSVKQQNGQQNKQANQKQQTAQRKTTNQKQTNNQRGNDKQVGEETKNSQKKGANTKVNQIAKKTDVKKTDAKSPNQQNKTKQLAKRKEQPQNKKAEEGKTRGQKNGKTTEPKPNAQAKATATKNGKATKKGTEKVEADQQGKLERPMRPEGQRSFNPQKLVYWGRDKKEQDYLVVIRLNEKERKIDRWLVKETLLQKEHLQRLLNNRAKLNENDLPQGVKPKNLNFSNRNLMPTGFTTNQEVFISQSWLNWHKQLERKENFEKMKEEIIKLHNNVKANTYFDGSLENEILKLRDRVLNMEQEENTSPQQSKKLNEALGKCYELLKKKRKKKTIKE